MGSYLDLTKQKIMYKVLWPNPYYGLMETGQIHVSMAG